MTLSGFLRKKQELRGTGLFIIFLSAVLLFGCGDEKESSPLKPEETSINFLGEMKSPVMTGAPAAPQMPGIRTPTVTEVGYYSDSQLTEPLTGTVQAGTTIFTKVVFSESMRQHVSNTGKALPILFYVIGEKETRYRIKPHDATGENFQSGDSKPLDAGTDDYICKYRVEANDNGLFTLKVGKSSVDTDGNKLADHYVPDIKLSLGLRDEVSETPEEPAVETPVESGMMESATVVEISHYSNGG